MSGDQIQFTGTREEFLAKAREMMTEEDTRPCTCHPNDNPPFPCARKYALSDCQDLSGEVVDEPHRAIRAVDARRIKLWFFRDLSDDQRLKMFSLLGWPVEEMETQSSQMFALRSVIGLTPNVVAAPEVKRTHT